MVMDPSLKVDHWLYKIIPLYREDTKWWNYPLWLIFGNDDDGIFGEGTNVWWSEWVHKKASLWTATKWWFRNPFKNLVKYVLNWKKDQVRVLVQYLDLPTGSKGWKFWFKRSQFLWVDAATKQFSVVLSPPLIQGRGIAGMEFYLGFKADGSFGAALRKNNAAGA